jgi:hypothetical protein
MPTYIYATEDRSQFVQRHYPLSKAPNMPPRRIRVRGVPYFHDVTAEFHGRVVVAGNGYPRVSRAAGIHRDDVPRQKKEDAKRGLSVKYTPEGNPVFSNPTQEKRYLESYGLYHRDCYGGKNDARRLGRDYHGLPPEF